MSKTKSKDYQLIQNPPRTKYKQRKTTKSQQKNTMHFKIQIIRKHQPKEKEKPTENRH